MDFFDTVVAKNIRSTEDGYIVADAPAARTGVQLYRGSELGRPDMPFVRVYRPEEEVFHADSLHSYAHRPMTNDHPTELVDASNWKQYAIGQTGDEVVRDGDMVRVPLVLMDSAAIADFENGKRELSMGYTADIDFLDEAATTDDGLEYDAVQKNLRMNHLALVQKGRAGNTKIGDGRNPENAPAKMGGHSMPDLKKVVVDGLTIETTTQGAELLTKLQAQLADSAATIASHADVVALHDAELAKRDAEIETLKGAALSDEEMAQAVSERAELVSTAKSLHDADYTGMTGEAIRKAVVVGVVGDAMADKSAPYLDARFDMLVEGVNDSKGDDPVRKALGDSDEGVKIVDADKAHSDYVDYLTNAHKAQ